MTNWGTVCSLLGIATSIVGFVTLLVRSGVTKGRQDSQISTIERECLRHSTEIKALQDAQGKISVEFAKFMGRLEADIKYIRESLDEVKRKKEV